MVLVLEEVDWPPVLNVVDRNDGGKNPFGDVKDRSVSYLDLREQFSSDNKVFESVRRFGRPRQQISDVLTFLDSDPQVKFGFDEFLHRLKTYMN